MVPSMATTPPQGTRLRAPKRQGERRQVTVPHDLWQLACAYAEAHGTTTNDALIQLAQAGAQAYARDQAIESRARAVAQAIRAACGAGDTALPLLDADEARAIAAAYRDAGD